MTNVVKGIGRGARQMVRFPGPFSKKGKKKRARASEQQDTPRSGYSSAEEATDFYSDLEEESPARAPPPGLAQANLLDNAQSDASERASLAAADNISETSHDHHRYPSGSQNLNWDDSTTFRHVNGVTVYEQQEPDSKHSTYMVSASVHASPEDCLKGVLDLTGGSTSDTMLFQSVMIEQLADRSRVLKARFQPGSWMSALAAPRETVVEQLWRQDENGVYLVMVHSMDHPAVPVHDVPWYHWFSPVRAQVISAGWTLSPLQPEYLNGRTSHQCLVTLVLKLDLGGWLSSSSGSFMGSLLHPLMNTALGRTVQNAFLQPLMMSVISLRDSVEQSRFLVPPFTLGESVFVGESRKQQQHQADEPDQQGGTRSMLAHLRSSKKRSDHQQRSYTLDTKFWRDPGVANFKVRGPNYLKDSKKIKSAEPYFELLTTELCATEDRVFNVSRFLPSIRDCKAPFVFVLNVIFSKQPRLGLVMAWASSLDPYHNDKPWDDMTPHERCLQEFVEGATADPAANRKRDNMLKLIPSVPQGSWIIKQAVGSTPVLLGNKIHTSYHRGPRWLEADVDMDSSGVANHVVALVKGVTTSQTIDMAVVLQGSRPDLLPERLLGSVRFSRLDLKTAIPLNPNDYPDDLLDPSPPPSPHPHMSGLSNNSIEHSQSLQSTYSLRSASGSGSTTALDNGHLDGLRQASGSNKGQPDGPSMPQTRLSASSDRNMAGPNHPGPLSFAPATSERPWPAQQLHTNTFGHNLPGLSTVPEAQQQPPAPPAQQQAILRASSLQPQRSLQQSGVSTIKHRMTRAQSGQDPNIPTERAKWSDRPVMSGHF
ncbi:TPA: hypothetical protein ACH3X2_013170 [Trebouxia sp. C0005]